MATVVQAQAGIRSQPVSPALMSVLERAAAAAGVTVRVTSGGQAAKGSGGPRTGSTRHDHGNAADIQLLKNGQQLNFTKSADQRIFQTFVQTAIANGANGIGAGTGYMGPNTIHVGFGRDGKAGGPVTIWGAKGGSPAQWLVSTAKGKSAPQVAPTMVASNVPMPKLRPANQTAALRDRPYYPVDPTAYRRASAFAPEGQANTAPFEAMLNASRSQAARAASGLQGYLPGSQVPTPNLRPKAAPVASQMARTGPIPPLPIPEAPNPPVTVPSGPLGAERVVQAALAGDAAGIRQAWKDILASPELMQQGPAVQSYFANIGQNMPQVASQVATKFASTPALWNSIPEKATIFGPEVRKPIQSAMNQVKTLAAPEYQGKAYDPLTGQYRAPVSAGAMRPTASAATPPARSPSPATGSRAASDLQGLRWTYDSPYSSSPAAPSSPTAGARAASGLQGYAKPAPLPIATAGFTAPRPLNTAQAAKAPPPKPTTQQVLNPAWSAWSSSMAANPMGWQGTPPPKYITRTIPAAAPAIAYAPTVKPQNAGLLGVTPPRSGGGGGGSSSSTSSSASPYYSSSVTQGPTTVGRNSSGQTSYVSGPSGQFSVDKNAGTFTSLTTGKTFSLF